MDEIMPRKFTQPVCSENEQRGIEYVSNRFNDLYDKTLKGLSAATRIAALCYNSPELKKMATFDEYGERWMEDISAALCALSNFDSNIRQRIIYSIHKAHEAYDIQDIGCRMEDLEE
nr:MAG TPA: hypothetical protein [Caudoviricetes sp.]